MLTAACLAISLATLGACCWAAYWVGRTRTLRDSEGYLAGKLVGYRDGITRHEHVRAALKDELAEVSAERDRLDAAVNEMAAITRPDRFAPIARKAVTEVYNHGEAGL